MWIITRITLIQLGPWLGKPVEFYTIDQCFACPHKFTLPQGTYPQGQSKGPCACVILFLNVGHIVLIKSLNATKIISMCHIAIFKGYRIYQRLWDRWIISSATIIYTSVKNVVMELFKAGKGKFIKAVLWLKSNPFVNWCPCICAKLRVWQISNSAERWRKPYKSVVKFLHTCQRTIQTSKTRRQYQRRREIAQVQTGTPIRKLNWTKKRRTKFNKARSNMMP